MRRRFRLTEPFDLATTLAPLRRGPGDPTVRIARGEVWRATRTPEGPAVQRVRSLGDEIEVAAWGPGFGWVLERSPRLLGLEDRPAAFRPRHPLLRRLTAAFPGMRIGASDALIEALVPTVLEQKVTSLEAHRSYRRLVLAHGEPAPGPSPVRLQPAPGLLAALPSYDLHPLGIERRRAETIRRLCRRAPSLERSASPESHELIARLTSLPGVGRWTATEVTGIALGDPDAVPPDDYNLPHLVSWALAGEARADDHRMFELLEPYRGHRRRVVRLLELSGIRPPRFGPRQPLRRLERI